MNRNDHSNDVLVNDWLNDNQASAWLTVWTVVSLMKAPVSQAEPTNTMLQSVCCSERCLQDCSQSNIMCTCSRFPENADNSSPQRICNSHAIAHLDFEMIWKWTIQHFCLLFFIFALSDRTLIFLSVFNSSRRTDLD